MYIAMQKIQILPLNVLILCVRHSDTDGIYDILKDYLQAKNIPLNDSISFAADPTYVMFGAKGSVVGLLKKDYPHVVARGGQVTFLK